MKLKKNLMPLACCILVVMLLAAGCAGEKSAEETEEQSITIIDSAGRSVELPLPLEKVIVLNSDAAEAICILKKEDTIIGVPENVQTHPYLGLDDRESVGKWNQPSFEKMVELGAQAVISYASSSPGEEVIEKLEPAGVKVVLIDLYKPDTYDQELKILAKMFGKEKEADAFIKWKAEQIAILDGVKGIAAEQQVSVFAMSTSKLAQDSWGTYGVGTATHQAIERSGGINVAREMESYPEISAEWILEQNPEAVIFSDYTADKMVGFSVDNLKAAEEFVGEVKNNKVFSKTDAAKNGRIYVVDNQLVGGDKTYLGALYLAKHLYPEQSKKIDPDKVLKEYFEQWLGISFKGQWFYPPVAK